MILTRAFLPVAVLAMAATGGAAPCPPSLAAIHDYQAGDVFQYRAEGNNAAYSIRGWESLRKARILSRKDAAGIRTFEVHSRIRLDTLFHRGRQNRTLLEKLDTLVIADSAGHALNACAGDTVPNPEPGHHLTLVEIKAGDTAWSVLALSGLAMKRIGKTEIAPRQGPIIADGTHIIHTYADGLGLIRKQESGYPGWHANEAMIGYTRSGATRGEVLSDAEMSEPLSLRPARAALPRGKAGKDFDARGRSLERRGGWNIRVTPPARD